MITREFGSSRTLSTSPEIRSNVKNLKKFEKNFIGTSENAHSCNIINTEVLRFHYDKSTKLLTAKAFEPLIIENFGLGYTIHYALELFELQKDGTFKYLGSAQFNPMKAKSEAITELWEINRNYAYNGSKQHFLRTLTRDPLMDEGFIAHSVRTMYPAENEEEVKTILNQHRNPMETDITISPGRYIYERRLSFKDKLHVIHTKESESHEYGTTKRWNYRPKSFQQSWISSQEEGALFNTLGYLNEPESVKFIGYWAFEKMSEALPSDYDPEKD